MEHKLSKYSELMHINDFNDMTSEFQHSFDRCIEKGYSREQISYVLACFERKERA